MSASAVQPARIDKSSSQRAERMGIGSLTPITFSSRHACDNAHSSGGERKGSSASRSSGGRSVNGVRAERFSFTSLDFSPCRSSDRVRLPDLRSRPELLLRILCGKLAVNAMLAEMLTSPLPMLAQRSGLGQIWLSFLEVRSWLNQKLLMEVCRYRGRGASDLD